MTTQRRNEAMYTERFRPIAEAGQQDERSSRADWTERTELERWHRHARPAQIDATRACMQEQGDRQSHCVARPRHDLLMVTRGARL
jgi:hypothetical protein